MTVSLFAPIVQSSNSKENLVSLRFTTRFFNFGQTCYRVTPLSRDQFLYLEQAHHQKPHWLGVVLRIVAIMTIIIPIFMIIGAMIYRAANKFVVKQIELTNHFSDLLPDIQKLICNKVFLDSKALRLVNKQLNSFFNEKNLDLVTNILISHAFENCLNTVEMMNRYQISEGFSRLAQFFLQNGYKKQALELLNEKYERSENSEDLRRILTVMALCDLDKALEIAHVQEVPTKNIILSDISVEMISIDLNKALKINNSIQTSVEDDRFLSRLAIETAKFDLEKGVGIADTIAGTNRFAVLIRIIKNIEESHPEKAKELFDQHARDWASVESDDFVHVIRYYARNHSINEAIRLADQRHVGYAFIASEYVKVNPEAALEWVKTLAAKKDQFFSMAQIVKSTHDPEKAKELIEHMFMMNEYAMELLNVKTLICADLMVAFDVDRAIEMANSLILGLVYKAQVLTCIIKKLIGQDRHRALKLAKTVLNIGEQLPCMDDRNGSGFSITNNDKFRTFLSLAEALRASIPK